MLRVENISKSYNGKYVLNDISFSLDEGEKAGIIGLNGIGKTTLLRIIAGEEKPDSGKIIKDKKSLVCWLVWIRSKNKNFLFKMLKRRKLKNISNEVQKLINEINDYFKIDISEIKEDYIDYRIGKYNIFLLFIQ